MKLWNLSTTNTTFLRDVSSLYNAAQYQSCVTGSVGSVVLKDSRLNTSTVAYYTGITPGSRACFVCDEKSGYELNTTINERICQSDATWSENPVRCGMYAIYLHKHDVQLRLRLQSHTTAANHILGLGFLISTRLGNP